MSAPAVRVWRAANRWDARRRLPDVFPVSDSFDTFDAAADYAAELDSRAAARGDILHLFVS